MNTVLAGINGNGGPVNR